MGGNRDGSLKQGQGSLFAVHSCQSCPSTLHLLLKVSRPPTLAAPAPDAAPAPAPASTAGGWRTSATGACRGSCGGATASPPSTSSWRVGGWAAAAGPAAALDTAASVCSLPVLIKRGFPPWTVGSCLPSNFDNQGPPPIKLLILSTWPALELSLPCCCRRGG